MRNTKKNTFSALWADAHRAEKAGSSKLKKHILMRYGAIALIVIAIPMVLFTGIRAIMFAVGVIAAVYLWISKFFRLVEDERENLCWLCDSCEHFVEPTFEVLSDEAATNVMSEEKVVGSHYEVSEIQENRYVVEEVADTKTEYKIRHNRLVDVIVTLKCAHCGNEKTYKVVGVQIPVDTEDEQLDKGRLKFWVRSKLYEMRHAEALEL